LAAGRKKLHGAFWLILHEQIDSLNKNSKQLVCMRVSTESSSLSPSCIEIVFNICFALFIPCKGPQKVSCYLHFLHIDDSKGILDHQFSGEVIIRAVKLFMKTPYLNQN